MLLHELGCREIAWDFAPRNEGVSEGALDHAEAHAIDFAGFGVDLRDHAEPFFCEGAGKVTEACAGWERLADEAREEIRDFC